MSSRQILTVYLPVDFFSLEEAYIAERQALETNSTVYCWKSVGNENWLERGFSVVDVYGLIVLPNGLPATMDMPDDPIDIVADEV